MTSEELKPSPEDAARCCLTPVPQACRSLFLPIHVHLAVCSRQLPLHKETSGVYLRLTKRSPPVPSCGPGRSHRACRERRRQAAHPRREAPHPTAPACVVRRSEPIRRAGGAARPGRRHPVHVPTRRQRPRRPGSDRDASPVARQHDPPPGGPPSTFSNMPPSSPPCRGDHGRIPSP